MWLQCSRLLQVICAVALLFSKRGFTADNYASGRSLSKLDGGVREQGYKTEPHVTPQSFGYAYLNDGAKRLGAGYIFIANMLDVNNSGPHMYTSEGELVWYGNGFSTYRVQDFKMCSLKSKKIGTHSLEAHLCWTEREVNEYGQRSIIHKIFMNSDYTLKKNFTARGDVHEFQVVDNGTSFLTMDSKFTDWDLSPYQGPQAGVIKDACLLDYDIETGHKNYEWCYSDHLPLWETDLWFHTPGQRNKTSNVSGKGTQNSPWDFAHVNAVDKNSDGDYIASLRHLDQVIKVAGPNTTSGKAPGTVLWRLGGRSNDFQMDFNFSKQHDVKYVDASGSENTISMFDNAWEGSNPPSAQASSGKIVRVNDETMEASLLHEYPHPTGELSAGRGSMQILENGNVFIGWGKTGDVTEFSSNGQVLYHARHGSRISHQFSYRAYRHEWVGRPKWPLKLLSYSLSCANDRHPLYVYISWNGATEVRRWRLHTAPTAEGTWTPAGTHDKAGFETRIKLKSSAPYILVEALDSHDTVLSSQTGELFVPNPFLWRKCDEYGCPDHFDYGTASTLNRCGRFYPIVLVYLATLLGLVEVSTYMFQNMSFWLVFGRRKVIQLLPA